MCTKSEVREVMKETVAPAWMRFLLGIVGMMSVIFIGWLAYEVHNQEAAMLLKLNEVEEKHSREGAKLGLKLDNVRFSYASSSAELMGRIDRITDQVTHVKELALNRSSDRYTGLQAKSRNELMDERCRTVNRRLKEIEDAMEKMHKINL